MTMYEIAVYEENFENSVYTPDEKFYEEEEW